MSIFQRIANRYLANKQAGDSRRPGWLPNGTPEIIPEGTNLVLYPYENEASGSYGLVAFMGKQSKPFHNYTYRNRKHDRDKAMEQLIANNRAVHERKQKERDEKKEFSTSLFFGDILYTSWGYEQTRAYFYEITEVMGPKMLKVRAISKKLAPGRPEYSSNWEVVPVPGSFEGPEMRVAVQPGDKVKIKGHGASKWKGGPVSESGNH